MLPCPRLRGRGADGAAILGYNYQSSPFYEDSFNLLKGRGLSPEARGDSWLTRIYRQMIRANGCEDGAP